MPSVFRTWTYQQALDAIAATNEATVGAEGFKANQLYAEQGDHWQGGAAWPLGGALHPAVRRKMLDSIEPMFRPLDVIGEVLDNVANGVLDKEADVTFVARAPAAAGSEQEQAQAAAIAAMRGRMANWWDQHRFWEQARQAVRRSRWAARGALRLWITPDTYLVTRDAGGGVTTTSLPTNLAFDDALAAVHVMAPSPESGVVFVDPSTRQRCAIFFFNATANPSDTKATKFAELWFADGDETILRIVQEGASEVREFPVPIARRLPIAQMEAQLLITESVRRQQRSLNVIETLLMRVIESAGFPERYTTNAMPSGVWLDTPPLDGPPLDAKELQQEDGTMKRWYLHQVPRVLGPMITTDLHGLTGKSGTAGDEVIMQPGVIFKEPTDPEYLTKASNHGRQTMLRACKQGHLATDSTAESSGLAYQQARAVFGKDLRGTKAPLEAMVRDIIEAAIALAESMSGRTPGRGDSFLAHYRCVVNLHVDTGPTSPVELAEFRAQNAAGLLSRETAMARGGVEDTDAEIDALSRDPVALATLRKLQGEAMRALQSGGATFIGSARALGLSDDEASDLQAADAPPVDPTP